MWDFRLIRYLCVGAMNTLIGLCVFWGFLFLRIPYPVAYLIALLFSALFNFKTYGKWVFENPNNRLIFKYCIVYFPLYVVNVFGMAWLKGIGIQPWLGVLLMMLPCAILSFFLNKNFVYQAELIEP